MDLGETAMRIRRKIKNRFLHNCPTIRLINIEKSDNILYNRNKSLPFSHPEWNRTFKRYDSEERRRILW